MQSKMAEIRLEVTINAGDSDVTSSLSKAEYLSNKYPSVLIWAKEAAQWGLLILT